MSSKDEIRQFLQAYSVSIVGFAALPQGAQILEIETSLPRAVVFGYPLSQSVLATIQDRPTLIYKHHYKTVNWILDQTAFHLVRFIENKGRQALAIPASQTVDWEHHRGHISHKFLAREAGLGFIGRSGLLVSPIYGAQARYVSVLTDLEFEPDNKCEDDCGACRKCVAVCPAQAISEDGVDLGRCLARLDTFARIRGIGQHICGVCVKVCNGRS